MEPSNKLFFTLFLVSVLAAGYLSPSVADSVLVDNGTLSDEKIDAIRKLARTPIQSIRFENVHGLLTASIQSESPDLAENALGLCIKFSFVDAEFVKSVVSENDLIDLIENCSDKCALEAARLHVLLYGPSRDAKNRVLQRLRDKEYGSSHAQLVRLLQEFGPPSGSTEELLEQIASDAGGDLGVQAVAFLVRAGRTDFEITDLAFRLVSSDETFLNPKLVGFIGSDLSTRPDHYTELLQLANVFESELLLAPIERNVSIHNDGYYKMVLESTLTELQAKHAGKRN